MVDRAPIQRMDTDAGSRDRILFVTGRLAEHSLRVTLAGLARETGFDYEVAVLPISVAALMTPEWVARKLQPVEGVTRVMLPGHCRGDLRQVEAKVGAPVELGPEDLRDLPRRFGRQSPALEGYGAYSIEILAEINHAPRLTRDEILTQAESYRIDGADVIDLGCDPGGPWLGVGDAVKMLKDAGFRVSIDSFAHEEVELAVKSGAELVLSVNSTNRERATDWGVEVVAIPDQPGSMDGLDETADFLADRGVRYRLDPILEPIGFGFANSLARYWETRRRRPGDPIMMGVGNLTELTEVDSAGVNMLLAGFCEELGIRSVLTTAVINWARSSVKELDLSRRLARHAVEHRTPPKHIDDRLVMLRDPRPHRHGTEALDELRAKIKDPNWRIFAEGGMIRVMNNTTDLALTDPFGLFAEMGVDEASHAFYLGYEMAKAVTALTLDKEYRQDRALDWGFLTRPEISHRGKGRDLS